MGRRDYKHARRPQSDGPEAKPRKGGGLGTGLFIGLILGMVIAGGLYWYLNTQPTGLKNAEPAPDTAPSKTLAPAPEIETPSVPKSSSPEPNRDHGTQGEGRDERPPEPPPNAPVKSSPKTDYSFYDILPGNARPQPKPQPQSQPKPKAAAKAGETLWLQIAALRAPADADRLKARLSLLALPVMVQKVESGDAVLYRVRVGPFKSEDDGLDALDTLSENNFEPRWVKDPVNP